jgi:hypothetical protein
MMKVLPENISFKLIQVKTYMPSNTKNQQAHKTYRKMPSNTNNQEDFFFCLRHLRH